MCLLARGPSSALYGSRCGSALGLRKTLGRQTDLGRIGAAGLVDSHLEAHLKALARQVLRVLEVRAAEVDARRLGLDEAKLLLSGRLCLGELDGSLHSGASEALPGEGKTGQTTH